MDQPHRHGHIIPTEVVTKFLRDPQTDPLTVLGLSRNITAHLLALINDNLDPNWRADGWTLVQLPATMPRSEPSSSSI